MNRSVTSFANATFALQLLLFGLLAGAFYLAYADTIRELEHYWKSGQNWQFLIPVAFVYMLWDRKEIFQGLEIRPNIAWGSLLLAFSMALLIAGQISYTHSLREISLVSSVFALVLLLFGNRYVVKLFWPLAYLALMTSLPTDLLAMLSSPLKLVSATVGANALELFGYPVYREGNVLYLPRITLVVADECSGLNQLMSAIALGVPIAFTMVNKWWKRVTILLLSCLFGIMANWLRVFLIAVWHYGTVKSTVHGPHEIYQLPFIFLVGVFLTFVIALAMADKEQRRPPASSPAGAGPWRAGLYIRNNRAAPLVAIALFAATALYLGTWKVTPVYLQQALSQFPMSIAGFRGKAVAELGSPFYSGVAQNELAASYTGPGGLKARVFIGYFPSQNAEQELIDYRYNWLHDGATAIDVEARPAAIRMKRKRVETAAGPETAYFVYDINGRTLIDPKRVKFVSLLDAFFHRRSNGAIIIVLFAGESDTLSLEQQAFLGKVLEEVRARL